MNFEAFVVFGKVQRKFICRSDGRFFFNEDPHCTPYPFATEQDARHAADGMSILPGETLQVQPYRSR